MAGSMGMGRSLGTKKFRINSKQGKDDPKAKEKREREEKERIRSRKDKDKDKDDKTKGVKVPVGGSIKSAKKADKENDKKVKKSVNKQTFHDTVKEEQGKNFTSGVLSKINSDYEKSVKEREGKKKGLKALGAAMDRGLARSRAKKFGEKTREANSKKEAKGNMNDVVRETKGNQRDVNHEAKGIQKDFGIEAKRNASTQKRESSLPDFPQARTPISERGESSGGSVSDRNPEPSRSVSSTSEKQQAKVKGNEIGR